MLSSVQGVITERSARRSSLPCPRASLTHLLKVTAIESDQRVTARTTHRAHLLKATQISDAIPELPKETNHAVTPLQLLQNTTHQQWLGFMELARTHNYIPSCLLALLGAWKSLGLSWIAFTHVRVWVMSFVAAGVAVGSVIVNDYFDYIDGVDLINAPEKPLPSGIIQPDVALLATLITYVAVLVAGCTMEPAVLRWIIAYSAASTLIYTPVLKSLTLIKNFVVASVIALSPIAGALAAGTGYEGLRQLSQIGVFVFGAIVFREILMDINDTEGDRSGSVYTLPVVFGRLPALLFATLFFSLTSFFVGQSLATSISLHSLTRFLPSGASRGVALSLFCATIVPMYCTAFECWRKAFDETYLTSAIDRVMSYIAASFLALILIS